ncbi:MAG: hypothetical protein ACLU99_01800 [Alphaproteobacteria bacterium]
MQNLLIPIPEEILNDENLTPQLVSSDKPDDIKKEIEVERKLKEEVRPEKPLIVKKEEKSEPQPIEPAKHQTPQEQKKRQHPQLAQLHLQFKLQRQGKQAEHR